MTCVTGTLLAMLLRRAKAPFDGTFDVYAKIYPGHLDDIPASYLTFQEAQTGTLAVITGTKWCARCVPVPDLGSGGTSLPGTKLTALAWQVVRATQSVEAVSAHIFYGVNPGVGGKDCCSGCGSDSGSGNLLVAAELADGSDLLVSVPDGPNAGQYRASPVSTLTWRVVIRKDSFEVSVTPDGKGLLLRGPSASAASTSMEFGPFSATLPGETLGSAKDAVVTKA